MPALLKRLIFQVGPNPNERTVTFSSVSNDGHFISLRPLAKPQTAAEKEFPFEWAFAGTKDDVKVTPISEGVVTQDFNFWFDGNKYLNIPNTHSGVVNTTWKTWESGLIEETGTVFPTGSSNPGVDFRELWQPMDFNKSEEVIAPLGFDGSKGKSIVLKVSNAEYDGLLVVVGRWVQGFLSKKNESTTKGLSFIRLIETNGSYETANKYGVDVAKFPTKFTGLKAGETVESSGLNWEVIEYHV